MYNYYLDLKRKEAENLQKQSLLKTEEDKLKRKSTRIPICTHIHI